MTARRAHAYPQVDVRAAGLVDMRVIPGAADVSASQARALLRKRDAAALALPGGGLVLREDLGRAVALALPELPAADLARVVPSVAAREAEVTVRRRLLAGAPAVLVLERRTPVGAVSRAAARAEAGRSMPLAARLRSRLPAPALALLAEVGRIAAAADARAFAVGGLVRDALIEGGPPPAGRDVDVVVEGDGLEVARRAACALGGRLRIHPAFGTASIDGLAAGRLDIATARAERYPAPGALPAVRPGSIVDDLERRDFGANALAVELASGDFGLLDPVGGRRDIARRRIRVLHPLSFVEDPTRIFRAARYAVRLGFGLDHATRRAMTVALRLAPYAALSGQRIAAEIEHALSEPAPAAVLVRLGRAGAFRLLDPRVRFSAATARRLRDLGGALAWAQERGLAARPLELAALAILADRPADGAAAALRRLGLAGEPLARLIRAREAAPALVERLARSAHETPSRRAALLRERAPVELAGAWLAGGAAARAQLDWYCAWAAGVRAELRGEDLVRLGVARGPAVRRALERLRDARLDGEARSRAEEIERVRSWSAGVSSPAATRKEG